LVENFDRHGLNFIRGEEGTVKTAFYRGYRKMEKRVGKYEEFEEFLNTSMHTSLTSPYVLSKKFY